MMLDDAAAYDAIHAAVIFAALMRDIDAAMLLTRRCYAPLPAFATLFSFDAAAMLRRLRAAITPCRRRRVYFFSRCRRHALLPAAFI